MRRYIFKGSTEGTYTEKTVFSVEANSEEEARSYLKTNPLDYVDDVLDMEHIKTDKNSTEIDELIDVEEI